MLIILDPYVTSMVGKSVEADGDENTFFTNYRPLSQKRRPESPVRFSQEFSPSELGSGSFVASTPGSESNR